MAQLQTIKLTQGVDWSHPIKWPDNPELILKPSSDRAYMEFFQLRRVENDLTRLTFKDSKDLVTLSKAAGELTLYTDHINIFIPGKKTKGWDLFAVNDPITRTVVEGTPPTVTLTYPVQLIHARLYVTDSRGRHYGWSGVPFEFEMEVVDD